MGNTDFSKVQVLIPAANVELAKKFYGVKDASEAILAMINERGEGSVEALPGLEGWVSAEPDRGKANRLVPAALHDEIFRVYSANNAQFTINWLEEKHGIKVTDHAIYRIVRVVKKKQAMQKARQNE